MRSCDPNLSRGDWSLVHRLAFRFVFVYLVLYSLVDILAPRSFVLIPGLSHLLVAHARIWHVIVPWTGRHILHLDQDITDRPITGFAGGDTTFHFVQLLCYIVIAGLAMVVWSLADARRTEYRWLHDWLRTFVRYTLALTMLAFGSIKVIKLQFPDPSLMRLVQPLGDFEPTALLWAFMGASKSYTFFSGAAELLGGLLLFFRQTTTLGAMITGSVMLNVTMMNFSYDVPVKLLALHQVLLSVLLIIPDVRRLLHVFVLNRPVLPAEIDAPFGHRWVRIAATVAKTVVIGNAMFVLTSLALRGERRVVNAPKPPLYGIWQVEEFARDGRTPPPLVTDSGRWRQVIIQTPIPPSSGLVVKLMDDTLTQYSMAYDGKKKTLTISPVQGEKEKDVLIVSRPDGDRLTLEGRVGNDVLRMTLRRIDESQFPLRRKGFHWINDSPWVPR